jgi:hypothetical protein
MDMWMMLELLIPRMQHAEEADVCTEMLRIACDLKQRLGADTEQQVVNHALVL